MTPEGKVKAACKKRWDQLGLLWRMVAWVGRRGAPDCVVMAPALFIRHPIFLKTTVFWVETKCKKLADGTIKVDEHQEREHKRMRAAGQVVLLIADQSDIDRWFPHG